MKYFIAIIILLSGAFAVSAQDTINIESSNAGYFKTFTTEVPDTGSTYSESIYAVAGGGTAIFFTAGSSSSQRKSKTNTVQTNCPYTLTPVKVFIRSMY